MNMATRQFAKVDGMNGREYRIIGNKVYGVVVNEYKGRSKR